jgi:hypothetical protein
MINNRFNVVYHLLYECKLNFIQLKINKLWNIQLRYKN